MNPIQPLHEFPQLELEKMLNLTVHMPQFCEACNELIFDKHGNTPDSLVFHTMNGIHTDWRMGNKVPMHKHCHTSFHSSTNPDKYLKLSTSLKSRMPYHTDFEHVLYILSRHPTQFSANYLRQQTNWSKSKCSTILDSMVTSNSLALKPTQINNKWYFFYEVATQ